jgi:hypothetical protein
VARKASGTDPSLRRSVVTSDQQPHPGQEGFFGEREAFRLGRGEGIPAGGVLLDEDIAGDEVGVGPLGKVGSRVNPLLVVLVGAIPAVKEGVEIAIQQPLGLAARLETGPLGGGDGEATRGGGVDRLMKPADPVVEAQPAVLVQPAFISEKVGGGVDNGLEPRGPLVNQIEDRAAPGIGLGRALAEAPAPTANGSALLPEIQETLENREGRSDIRN